MQRPLGMPFACSFLKNFVWVNVIILKISLKPAVALRNLSLVHKLGEKRDKCFSLSTVCKNRLFVNNVENDFSVSNIQTSATYRFCQIKNYKKTPCFHLISLCAERNIKKSCHWELSKWQKGSVVNIAE